ncbi:MAG: hypothetical protein IPJ77_06335 [Planctomycetes bacterium]|nr:hypothetical protein [Planctomycetota bacterium]
MSFASRSLGAAGAVLVLPTIVLAQSPRDFALPGAMSPAHGRQASHLQLAPQSSAAALVNGSDSCSAPDPITGTGAFTFDNSVATTGTEGQVTTNCIQSSVQGLSNDVWFLWTAPQTGSVELSTCGLTTVDTKLAVYDGATCPAAGATALDCLDDLSVNAAGTQGFNFQSKAFWNAVSGNSYLIQLGTSPGTPGGAGSFTITYAAPDFPMATPCGPDDGSSETLQGWIANISVCALQREGGIGQTTLVSSISVAWGAPFAPAANNPANGGTATVAIWDDPNDDGDPTDAVLVQQQTATIAFTGTDTLELTPLSPPVAMTGVFFIGAVYTTPATTGLNNAPFPRDNDSCGYATRRSWLCLNQATTFDLTNLGANSVPPVRMELSGLDAFTLRGNFLLRADCQLPNPGNSFCAGDGLDPNVTTPCPCGNTGGPGRGCANSVNPQGALLVATGSPLPDTMQLQGSGMPATVSCIYLQGNALSDTVFGDGVRCTGGTLLRLRTRANVGGASAFPDSTDTISLSVRGGVVPGSGVVRQYQTYYRNSAGLFCPPETFNVTNGWQVTW